jgi:hypothetical protein
MAWENNLEYGRLQWAGHVIRVEEYRIPTKALQHTIHSKRRVKKHWKRWEDGVREDPVILRGTWALKTETKDTESWGQCIETARA